MTTAPRRFAAMVILSNSAPPEMRAYAQQYLVERFHQSVAEHGCAVAGDITLTADESGDQIRLTATAEVTP